MRASKIASSIVQLERDEISEKIELQVSQCKFKVNEANRRLSLARKNVENAEENLRCANVGFKEGVLQTTDVMAAQTAWLQAQSQKIDAEIDVRLSQVNLKKRTRCLAVITFNIILLCQNNHNIRIFLSPSSL